MPGVAESLRADYLRVHLFGHVPDWGHLADLVDFLMAHFNLLQQGRYSAAGGGSGWLAKSWFEISVKTRAGTSYLFASDKTILILHGLGNGAISDGGWLTR